MKILLKSLMNDYVNARNHEPIKKHPLFGVMRDLVEEVKGLSSVKDHGDIKIKGSIGQGNWATIPWLAIIDERITVSTQRGYYLVYLFSEDMERVYLTWNQGVTDIKKEHGVKKARGTLKTNAEKIFKQLDKKSLAGFQFGTIDLKTLSQDGQLYELGTVVYKEYLRDEIPDDSVLEHDLATLIRAYENYIQQEIDALHQVRHIKKQTDINMGANLQELIEELHRRITAEGFFYPYEDFAAFCLSLKTKPFVLLAGISGTGKTRLVELIARQFGVNEETIAVRPDWNDSSDLLGYADLNENFRPGPLLKVLHTANNNSHLPYFICLDEMNLARVEHYFAEVLSAVEKRKVSNGELVTPSLVRLQTKDSYWSDVYISSNVFLIGTVNMDETTYPFSKKVLDRANTLEFNHINLDFQRETAVEHGSQYLDWSLLKPEFYHLAQFYDQASDICEYVIARLKELNEILEEGQFQVGYRVRDEICLFMHYAEQAGLERESALDLQVTQKILPRILGGSSIVRQVLIRLWNWTTGNSLSGDEIDILPKIQDTEGSLYPWSANKISSMLYRLEFDGYTSFWV
ncbi:MAG: DUF3578 domain-containing protein [Firmicutes bacterium]|nr:DUF3578 domain-containing protein [Bacillota bacterium]